MRRFSSQYLITNCGPVLKRPVVTVDDDGTIVSVVDTGGNLWEEASVEFYNGIIVPGFVNCHCHLELSYLLNRIPEKTGLHEFIRHVRDSRNYPADKIIEAAASRDEAMFRSGVSLCADTCNTSLTFPVKQSSPVEYLNFIEIFGIDPARAEKRMQEAGATASEAEKKGLSYCFTPHSAYSVSLSLFSLIRKASESNSVTSIHFLESAHEAGFLKHHNGPLMDSYRMANLISGEPETVSTSSEAVTGQVTPSGNLLLVHNTYIDSETLNKIKMRDNLFFCLCPNSNLYIEDKLPPVMMLNENGCEMVIGTDSLASNTKLDVLSEIKTLQFNFPDLTISRLVEWATVNGARALGKEDEFGVIAPGKKPGLVLIENADLVNMKFTPETSSSRLI